MRVLLVHNFYKIPGGEDRVVREELALLAQNGVDVELFSAQNDEINGTLANIGAALKVVYNPVELSPKFGDGLKRQAAAVWDCEAAGLATSIPSVNLTP